MEEKHVADYFIISGVPENTELKNESIESNSLFDSKAPITDIAVIFKGLGEECPIGYTCIEKTPGGHSADLNNGNFKSPNILICFKRGTDKPPLVDIGVYHEDKDRVLPDAEVVRETPYGRCASTGNSGAKSGTYLTYRRSKARHPFNQLVVVDLCVILSNKSEHPPHAFFCIKKNLNKSYYGMIGSEVHVCYKKTILSPPSLCYKPQIISRFPIQDYANFPLPDTVPLFCLPAGASIELRPTNTPLPKPQASTFVLTSDSAQKIYGTAISFHEIFEDTCLNHYQKFCLGLIDADDKYSKPEGRELFVTKSICILSRWPFFDCFEKFLLFLYKLVFNIANQSASEISSGRRVPLEHHISHFLLDVHFPTPQRPTVMVQLMPGTDETVTISQPSSRLPLPLTGASFIQMLRSLRVDGTMDVLLFGLCEQKILLNSLNPWVLTGVSEAITAMLFPFQWQCPYVPLCPLSLHGILNAPLPFIVGIDSRLFDIFTPPDDIICVDLDTGMIKRSESKKCLHHRILPKRAARVLRSSLEKIHQRCLRIQALSMSPQHRNLMAESQRHQLERNIELEIQEAFLRFMATILRGFRSYLLPITRAPTIGATDPTSLFNFEGFLMSRDRNYSQFYQLITKTQMFTHYIEERSFLSDKNTSLAFFDDCEERLTSSDDLFSDRPIKLFDKDNFSIPTDRSVYIPAPEQSPSISLSNSFANDDQQRDNSTTSNRLKFGPLNPALFHRHPQQLNFQSLDKATNDSVYFENNVIIENQANELNSSFSISRRTKQEIKTSQKLARRCAENPFDWSKYLLSCCYSLWFSTLPSYVSYCRTASRETIDSEQTSKSTARILRYAYSTLVRMQKLGLSADEICFRILTLLCGYHGQPALAVRVFFEMKKAGIKPNAVTYGYYNRAVLESKWPDHSSKPTTVLWTKIRNVISGIALFKSHGRVRMERRNLKCMPLIGDPSFHRLDIDVVDRATSYTASDDIFNPSSLLSKSCVYANDQETLPNYGRGPSRSSLINRSFTIHHSERTASTEVKEDLKNGDEDYDTNDDDSESPKRQPNSIHKSYSMHLRNNSSPERPVLDRAKSSSTGNDTVGEVEEQPILSRLTGANESIKVSTSTVSDLFTQMRERQQLFNDSRQDKFILENLDLIDTEAGVLFTTNSSYKMTNNRDASPILVDLYSGTNSQVNGNNFLLNAGLPVSNNTSDANGFLNADSFGEDAQILRKLEPREPKRNLAEPIDFGDDSQVSGSDETRSNQQLSESIADQSDNTSMQDDDPSLLKNLTSTPNFKLSTLINDASNLQWSKWTSGQNSKSVYKNIKSTATGLLSSFQEIKSSFSNANTPSRLLTSAQVNKSGTRELLSQWANSFYNTIQPSRPLDDDSDASSVASNDLLRLSNEEDLEPSAIEANDFRHYHKLFAALEKHYNNSSSKEDLVDHMSDLNLNKKADQGVAIEVTMTTCCRCNICHSLLYDEEIMERWSHNESNLNTSCIYCRAKIVPSLTVVVEDKRFTINEMKNGGTKKPNIHEDSAGDTNDLVNLNFEEPDKHESETSGQRPIIGMATEEHSKQTFTVPYLSPIVLRKELESVFESSGDGCPTSSNFVDEHPIIYWNLLWCFSRINVPTHLALLCLDSASILNGREIPEEWRESDKVIVKTLWDNDKLHAEIGKPLYRQLARENPSNQVQAIVSDEIFFTRSFLERVINLIRADELHKAMNLVLNARLKSSTRFSFDKNRHNLYRDLIFLIIREQGPGRFYMDNFEREYRKAFDSLNFQQVALNRFDRPPTNGSLYCRKCFKDLSLCD